MEGICGVFNLFNKFTPSNRTNVGLCLANKIKYQLEFIFPGRLINLLVRMDVIFLDISPPAHLELKWAYLVFDHRIQTSHWT